MLGILLISLGTILGEFSGSYGKMEVQKKEESLLGMGFLSVFMGGIFIFASLLFGQKFVFSFESLPTFSLRLILEIVLTHMSIIAISKSDRSTFSFLRMVTIPLLVLVDVVLVGYLPTNKQIFGIFIIFMIIIISGIRGDINRKGIWWALSTGVGAVFTIALYKYNITHFNSVVAEQGIIYVALVFYFVIFSLLKKEGNLFKMLFIPKFFVQSSALGVSGLLESFAYLYAPASIILTSKRAFSLLWAELAGWRYFGEKNLLRKLLISIFLVVGVFLLI